MCGLVDRVMGNMVLNDIAENYDLVAVDESWSVLHPNSSSNTLPTRVESGNKIPTGPTYEAETINPIKTHHSLSQDSRNGIGVGVAATRGVKPKKVYSQLNELTDLYPIDPNKSEPIKSVKKKLAEKSNLINVEDSSGKNISDTLFRLPKFETSHLAKLITGTNKPTLVHDGVVMPELSKNSSSKVLATYRILVPIYIPAIKDKVLPKILKASEPELKYVKEVNTTKIPLTKESIHVQEVYRAERVPQEVITDYVKIDGHSLPSKADDAIKPNEKILASVVTRFD